MAKKLPQRRKAPSRRRSLVGSPLRIVVKRSSDRPIFLQIYEQVVELIAAGELAPGTRLPPVRTLAPQLGINQMTVSKAYRDLGESGFVEARRGGGTYVCVPSEVGAKRVPKPEETRNSPLLSERLYELANAPGVVSFTVNYPILEGDMIDEFKASMSAALEGDSSYFRYDPPNGRRKLRELIADYLHGQGQTVSPEEIVVTNGAQQAIDVVVRCLVPSGAHVVIERPAYYGAINALRSAQARILEVPVNSDGMDLAKLEEILSRHRPRLIYTNPTFQNPTGITMTRERRIALLELSRKYGVPILEDDHNAEWRFFGDPVPSLRALSEPGDQIYYVRSFGKVYLPGIRLGYLVAPPKARQLLLAMKARLDLHTNGLLQEGLAIFLERRQYLDIFHRMRERFAAKQNELVRRLIEGMPQGTLIDKPQGGLSLWLTLPDGTEVSELYFRAVRRGVAFVAGEVFYASHPDTRTLRVSFGSLSQEFLRDGVERLCSVVNDLVTSRGTGGAVLT